MLFKNEQMTLSPYAGLYDIVVPKDHQLRKIKELVDFSFVYEELKEKYCLTNGRGAVNRIEMFKYLFLKALYGLSDVDLVERSFSDMAIKYFLDKNSEDNVISPGSLTKFRRQRLKDTELLDLLLKKTVEIALQKGVLKGKSIIVDSTHTISKYNLKSPLTALKEMSKQLRKSVYNFDESIKAQMPEKPKNDTISEEIEYSKKVIEVIENNPKVKASVEVRNNVNLLQEFLDDNDALQKPSLDSDAKIGHKNADTSFVGYKSHLAMTEDRIIVSATVTSGEKHDGKELETLVAKAREAGLEIESVIGDAAYSEKANIEFCNNENISLISRLSKTVTHGNERTSGIFEYNKDADRYVSEKGI